MSNNIFGTTERLLYNYKDIDIKLKCIDLDIETLQNDISLKAISYDEKSAPTNAFSSSVENEVLRREEQNTEQIERLKNEKLFVLNKKKKLDLALSTLTEDERKLIELRYFTKPTYSWVMIGRALNMDKDNCCKKRNKIIGKIAQFIFN